jgi:hypothetical protein
MTIKHSLVTTLACFLGLSCDGPTAVAPALAEDAVAVALSGTIGAVIDKFEQSANRLLLDADNRGNALMSGMGNQLLVATQNAKLAFAEERDKSFDELNTTGKNYFIQLNSILRDASGPLDRAISVLEVANLNLMELTSQLPLTNKVYHYLNKMEGLTQIHQTGKYQLTITGLGAGQDFDDNKYDWEITVGDSVLNATSLVRTPPYTLTASIDKSILERYFSDTAYSFVPIAIKSKAVISYTCGLLFTCRKDVEAIWNMKMTLLPRFPGTVTPIEILRGEALDGVTLTKSVDFTTQGCTSDHPCDVVREIRLAANERVTGVRMSCTGQCGWSYALRMGGYGIDYDVLEGGTVVKVYRHNDGENPTTVTHYVDYQTLRPLATENHLTPIPMEFGKPFIVQLSAANTACAYRLKAHLVTGQDIFLDNSMNQSSDGLITQLGTGVGPAGVACAPSFSLNIP